MFVGFCDYTYNARWKGRDIGSVLDNFDCVRANSCRSCSDIDYVLADTLDVMADAWDIDADYRVVSADALDVMANTYSQGTHMIAKSIYSRCSQIS